jgi:hypothetical protein
MQIKYYTILDSADITAIQAWVADPTHRCIIVTKTLVGVVTRSLGVNQPEGPEHEHIFTATEFALGGMIVELTDPDMIVTLPDFE